MSGVDQWVNQIHGGDALETLRELPESSVHMVMCSPPYWKQRDYDVRGQIGLEDTLSEYIESIVDVGDAIGRVLREDGSWWLNLGDCYAGSGGPGGDWDSSVAGTSRRTADPGNVGKRKASFPKKSRLLIPHRVAIALQEAGWIVRQDIPWVKYGTPDPAADRFRTAHETVFHLVRKQHYWHDPPAFEDWGVFECPPAQFPDAHFAAYPESIVEAPVKATAPPRVCSSCGDPFVREINDVPAWERDRDSIGRPQLRRALELFESSDLTVEHLEAARAVGFSDAATGKQQSGYGRNRDHIERLAAEAKDVLGGYFREFLMTDHEFGEWNPACGCAPGSSEPGIVLDPFAGSGTTCRVAKRLGRRFIGIDLNAEYVAMAQRRAGIDVENPDLLLENGATSLTAYTDGGVSADD